MASRTPQSALPKNSPSASAASEDEIIREVYATRDAYAAEHDYDLQRIYNDLKRRERTSKLRPAPAD